jgi:lipid A 4'-phosphatase
LSYSSSLSGIELTTATIILCSTYFITSLELDILTANLFYEFNNYFLLRNSLLHEFIDAWVCLSLKYFLIIFATFAVWSLVSKSRFINWPIKNIAFVALALLLELELLVNGFLKGSIGRAHPKHITEFVGDKFFPPAYFPANKCIHNCSFVSCDVFFGFATIAYALLLNGTVKRIYICASILFGVTILYHRLVIGAHFLSDVMLAGLFSILIALICYKMLMEKSPSNKLPNSVP